MQIPTSTRNFFLGVLLACCATGAAAQGYPDRPIKLIDFIETLERALGLKAEKNWLPMQPGDVPATYADIDDLGRAVGFRPATRLEDGIARYVAWYREYYAVPA